MNNNKMVAIAAVVIVVLAGIGIAYMLTDNDSSDGDTITDARGRKVAVPDEINSILAIKSCSLQLVSFFDAIDKVTCLDINESFTDRNRTHTYIMGDFLKGKNLPRVDPNDAEQVIAKDVDIVISSTVDISKLNEEQTKYGVPVFAINADVEFDSPIMYDQLRLLGKLFGEEERAQEIIDGIKSMISDIYDNVDPVGGVKGYACGMNFFGMGSVQFLRTSGDYLPFKYSKLENVSASNPAGVGGQPYDTSLETVIKNNPQLIFVDGMGSENVKKYIEDNKGTLQMIDAVTNKAIYKIMVYKNWGTNWVNQLINVYYVASIVHVGEFDWTFGDKANEIIQLFYPGTAVTYSDLANAQTGGGCGLVFEAPR
ncbi:MAG: ABC transporter substrate-binding protein [Candidatus Methanoplasma sp.]|jgi:iron complex transport system substrate-binding protein|nr:ABC transporter substrate-binding protein [Candidatus Methanoplasma sp.]